MPIIALFPIMVRIAVSNGRDRFAPSGRASWLTTSDPCLRLCRDCRRRWRGVTSIMSRNCMQRRAASNLFTHLPAPTPADGRHPRPRPPTVVQFESLSPLTGKATYFDGSSRRYVCEIQVPRLRERRRLAGMSVCPRTANRSLRGISAVRLRSLSIETLSAVPPTFAFCTHPSFPAASVLLCRRPRGVCSSGRVFVIFAVRPSRTSRCMYTLAASITATRASPIGRATLLSSLQSIRMRIGFIGAVRDRVFRQRTVQCDAAEHDCGHVHQLSGSLCVLRTASMRDRDPPRLFRLRARGCSAWLIARRRPPRRGGPNWKSMRHQESTSSPRGSESRDAKANGCVGAHGRSQWCVRNGYACEYGGQGATPSPPLSEGWRTRAMAARERVQCGMQC